MNSLPRINYSALQGAFYRTLTIDQCQSLHDASLAIMERTGMRFLDDEAVSLLKKGGAAVSDGNLVRIPQHLVEWAIRTAPKQISLYDQTGRNSLCLGWHKTHYGPLTDCLYIRDRHNGARRPATLADLQEAIRICDALPNVDFLMSLILASDCPTDSADVHQARVMMEYGTKPLIFVTYRGGTTRYVIDLAEAMAGGADELRRRPFLVNYININSPLVHNVESLRKLFLSVNRGIPIIYRPSIVTRGFTTPLTLAAFVALNNVGSLGGLVLSQLRQEGTPFIREGCSGGTMDQWSLLGCYGRPEARGFQPDLGQIYNLPTFGLAGASDSKLPDGQAAAEMSLTLTLEALSGNSLVHGIGSLESGMCACLELLPVGDEIISWLRSALRGLEISEDTLALEVIAEVGLQNQYIATEHAARHCHDDWTPTLLDPHKYVAWEELGGLSLLDRAKAKVEAILKERHGPRVLTQQVIERMDSIVAEADRMAPSLT